MALFQYFPSNYVWNLAVNMALESGAQIGEIEDMCGPLREAASRGNDAGTAEFLEHRFDAVQLDLQVIRARPEQGADRGDQPDERLDVRVHGFFELLGVGDRRYRQRREERRCHHSQIGGVDGGPFECHLWILSFSVWTGASAR